ncbi:hypothetical protein INR49_018984, partial [Caranx melampygus]
VVLNGLSHGPVPVQADGTQMNDGRGAEEHIQSQMSDDLVKQLSSYKAQLQQVEVALSTDPDNEDLLKLQKDLQEVIDLTKDLLTSQPTEGASTTNGSDTVPFKHGWKVGDRCMATWSQDGQVYEAEIEEIDRENGTAAVTFTGYGNAEVIPLQNLKAAEEGRRTDDDGVKRSIFASPESVNGKVGVGTCGIADKPMTQYHDTSKYNSSLSCSPLQESAQTGAEKGSAKDKV